MNLRYRDGVFYTGLGADHWAGRMGPCLPSAERGPVHTVDTGGRVELLGRGLREPDGIGFGLDGEVFATDNDGEWVAANKRVHVRKEDFYGLVPCQTWDPSLVHARPAVWFPEHLHSPGEPLSMPTGPFRGQLIVGDYEIRNLSRIFLEKVGGRYQGAMFPFTGGLRQAACKSSLAKPPPNYGSDRHDLELLPVADARLAAFLPRGRAARLPAPHRRSESPFRGLPGGWRKDPTARPARAPRFRFPDFQPPRGAPPRGPAHRPLRPPPAHGRKGLPPRTAGFLALPALGGPSG